MTHRTRDFLRRESLTPDSSGKVQVDLHLKCCDPNDAILQNLLFPHFSNQLKNMPKHNYSSMAKPIEPIQ